MAEGGGATMVGGQAQMELLLAEIREGGRMGLDTEFLREKTYFARLCLVQVSTTRGVYLIDPLSGAEPSHLSEVLADPAIEVVVHAGWQDLQIFFQRSGCVPTHVFDVQLAAGFAGLSASLAYGRLVEQTLGVVLEKGEAYSDWCRRPLTARQISYAADDVRYLLPVADWIQARLAQLGRLAWAQEEMRALESAGAYEANEEMWRKVAGQGVLSPRQAAVLRELARWREQSAAERDLPRGWLMKDPTLIEVARRAPRSVEDLKTIRGLDAREADRSGKGILAAIERGLAAPAVKRPTPASKNAQARARMAAGLADALLRARAEAAEIAPELVGNRADLEDLLLGVLTTRGEPEGNRLLFGWRRQLAGEAILALALGRCALRVSDRPPYIQEIAVEE